LAEEPEAEAKARCGRADIAGMTVRAARAVRALRAAAGAATGSESAARATAPVARRESMARATTRLGAGQSGRGVRRKPVRVERLN